MGKLEKPRQMEWGPPMWVCLASLPGAAGDQRQPTLQSQHHSVPGLGILSLWLSVLTTTSPPSFLELCFLSWPASADRESKQPMQPLEKHLC